MSNNINNIAWFLKYQPSEVEDYVFNDTKQEEDVRGWISSKIIPGNLLLYGPAGCGKTSLAELLINNLIEKDTNIKIIKSRSVSEIDTLYTWLQRKSAKPDIKKIIYIEEFDRLSITAMNQLKDTLLEKFQEYASFIVCTNYINKIPHPILTRFTYKYELKSLNMEGTLSRVSKILNNENISFNLEDLSKFIEENYKTGLRDIINVLQIHSINGGNIDLSKLSMESTETIENRIVELTQLIFEITLKGNSVEKRSIYTQPTNSKICNEYTELIELIQFNYNINWEEIYIDLYERNTFLPIIQVIEKYINGFEMKKIQHIHFLAFLCEGIERIIKINI